MMAVMMMATNRVCQILKIGELTAGGRTRKVAGELRQLLRSRGISLRLVGLGGGLQIGGDLLRHLLILRRVSLLKLLELTHHLSEGRESAVVLPLGDRRPGGGAENVAQAKVLEWAKDRL